MSLEGSPGGQEGRTSVLLVKADIFIVIYAVNSSCSYLLFFPLTSHLLEQQKSNSQHFPSRPFVQRRPGPQTMAPSKTHVPSQLTSQLVSINALFNTAQSQNLLQSHSHGASSTTASGSGSSNSAPRPSMSEMSGHGSVGPGNTDPPTTVLVPRGKLHCSCFFLFSRTTVTCGGIW